jgi:hypothetical protein
MQWKFHDGGRRFVGFSGFGNDCVIRAITIYSGKKYLDVLQKVNEIVRGHGFGPAQKEGVPIHLIKEVFSTFGIKPKKEIKSGILFVSQSQGFHAYAVMDGVAMDIFKPEVNEKVIQLFA